MIKLENAKILKNFKHTLTNLILGIIFVVITLKNSTPDKGLVMVVIIYLAVGLFFDFIIFLLNRDNDDTLAKPISVVFFAIAIWFTVQTLWLLTQLSK